MLAFLLTFTLAFLVTFFCVPIVSKFAYRINAVDRPTERKIHKSPVPRLGGIAIYCGFAAAILAALLLAAAFNVRVDLKVFLGVFLASSFLLLVGIADDLWNLKPAAKLAGQIIAGLIVIYFGLAINFISNPFNGIYPLGVFVVPLTLLWVVGMTNALNLIDGLDGLAAGVTGIASMTLFFVALRTHQIDAALLMLALGGASLGFLRYNFFPASIFLGDSGSMLLGFILAVASITGVFKTTLVVALVVPVLILGVPIFDTLFAIIRRINERKNPFEADNRHFHHLLLRAGFNQREAVFAIYIVCFLLSFIALVMALLR